MSEVQTSGGGVGFLGMLTILFIGLKLTGYVGWSWWWVLAPTWIPIALVVTVVLAAILVRCFGK